MPPSPSPPSQVFYRNPKKAYPVAGRSEGIHIYDAEGNRYIDFSGGPVVMSIGHGVAEIAEAAAAQMERFSFVHGSQFTHPAQEELARRMAALAPGDLDRLFPLTSGSEAVESAIKLARQYHLERGKEGKHLIIARLQSFHGASLGALSATGEIRRREKFLPMLLPFPHIAPCHCYRCPFEKTYPDCEVACASDLERAMHDLEQLAAGAVRQRDAAKAAVGALASNLDRTVPDLARIVGQREAEANAIPELLAALTEQITAWRRL